MSDDDRGGFGAVFLKWPPFSFTPPIPPSSTRDDDTLPTFLTGTLTDFPASTPFMSSGISSSPAVTQTVNPTITDTLPSLVGPPDTLPFTIGDLSSFLLTLTEISSPTLLPTEFSSTPTSNSPSDSSITIDPSSPSPTSNPLAETDTSVSDPFSFTPTLSSESFLTLGSSPTPLAPSSTIDLSTTSGFSFTTMTTPSPASSDSILTSSNSFSTTSSDSTSLSSSTPTLKSYPPPVTQTILTFNTNTAAPAQTRTSTGHTGMVVAAVTGAIAFTIILALLAMSWRKHYLKKARRRAALDPFQDIDGEMIAINEPLIIGDGPVSRGGVYSDPFTDDLRPTTTQPRSLSPGTPLGSGGRSSEVSHQAVVNLDTAPTPAGSGEAGEYYHQRQPTDEQSQPPSATGTSRSRPQSLPPVQTQFAPQFPLPRPASPFDSGAVAYLQYTDGAPDRGPPSPGHNPLERVENNMLTSAFSVASELSPQYSSEAPPVNIDETWRNSPDPIKASSSYRRPTGRRQSFTPSLSGQVFEPGDTVVVTPLDSPTQGPAQGVTSPGSEDVWSPYTIRSGDFSLHSSPTTDLVEIPAHSQDDSNDSETWISSRSGGTSGSLPVVLTAERAQRTPALSLRSPSFTLSSSSHYDQSSMGAAYQSSQALPSSDDPPPPLPSLLPIQPLSLGKKKSFQP